jgi:Double-GTPase 2
MWLVYGVLFILGAAVAIAVLGLYLSYAAAAVLVAAGVAIAAYGAGLPAVYLAALGDVLGRRPAGLAPAETWPQPPDGADPAVLQYFYGPARADARHALTVAYQRCRDWGDRGAAVVRRALHADLPPLTIPAALGGAAGMVVGIAAGTLLTAGCALIYLLAVALGTAITRAAGAVLRGADSALLNIKNIRILCPYCGLRVPYPGYVCPGPDCDRKHHDVRPGRFGIIRRHCHCGQPMKTLLLFGSARMTAFCPHCGQIWEHGPGEVPEIVLALFGAGGAGKTRLLSAMVTQLMAWAAARQQFTAEPADQSTAGSLQTARQVLISGRDPGPTQVQLPRSLVIRAGSGRIKRIVHWFDAAGEQFGNLAHTDELRYLSEARTFILVIDPRPIIAFWRRAPGSAPAGPASRSPLDVYHRTSQQIEEMGVRLSEARLAMVFSHADRIDRPGGDVAAWASRELGLGNLVRSATLNFKETGFFCTAAVVRPECAGQPESDGKPESTDNKLVDRSIACLLRWVLAGSRLTLPGDDDDRSG